MIRSIRGCLTEEVKILMKDFLSEEPTIMQLKLLPFLFTSLMNNGIVDINKINSHDYEILKEWAKKGYIKIKTISISRLIITNKDKDFFDWMCKVLWLSYIAK